MSKIPEEIAGRPLISSGTAAPAFAPAVRQQAYAQFASTLVLLVADLAALALALVLAFLIRVYILAAIFPVFPPGVPPALTDQFWWVLGIGLLCLASEGLYTRRLPFWREVKRVVKAVTLAFLLVLAAVSLGKKSGEFSRTVIVLSYILWLFLLPFIRWTTKGLLLRLGLWERPVLILGAGKTGELIAAALLRERYLGYWVAGFLDDDVTKRAWGVRVNRTYFPVLGSFRDIDQAMAQTGVKHLIIAAPGMESKAMVDLINSLQRRSASVSVIPDLFGIPVMGAEIDHFFDEQILSLRIRNNLASSVNMFVKRLFDLTAGIIILLLTLPLQAVIALAIKLDSPGPVIFSHRRIGRGGREFNCYKFRTMVINAETVLQDF